MTPTLGVTGAAGFIGINFVKMALSSGYRVVAFDSFTYASNRQALEDTGIGDVLSGDLRNPADVSDFVASVDVVVNFAAETHNDNSLKNPDIFFQTNVMGTLNLAQEIAKAKKRLHHVSTDEVFGDLGLDEDRKFNESSPYNPSSPYSSSKAASDHLVRAWIRSFGLRATISNCSNNFGPYQHQEKFIPSVITAVKTNRKPQIYGDGANVRDWIHVDDHNSGILTILEKGTLGETYLLGANCEISNLELVALILEIMGKPRDFFELVEDRPGHDERYAIDASKAISELGWSPSMTNFKESLSNTIDWYIKNA
jgi:dTDP-glucose 4,6-dehydratase